MFITLCADNPDNKGQYRFGMSNIKAEKYRIVSAIQNGLDLNSDICFAIALCEGKSQYTVKTGEVKACTKGNFFCLRDPEDIHPLVNVEEIHSS